MATDPVSLPMNRCCSGRNATRLAKSLDEFKKWVTGFRPGMTIGKDMVQKFLLSKTETVCRMTVENYLALAIAYSETATASAKYKQEARDTGERSVRRNQALTTLICALEDSFVVVEVPGLCRGGCTDVNQLAVGYIVFVKNDGDKASESVDQAFFRWYHSKVALPFIASTRQHVFPDSGWQPGQDVPLGMEGVVLYDGGGPQRIALSESEYLDEAANCGVDGGKLNPNCTSVEQCLDVMPSFKTVHAEMAKVTAEPVSQGNDNRCDTLWQSARACIAQQPKVRLAPGRLNLLLNAVSRVPEIWNKAFTPTRIRQGWLKTGIVSQDGSGPDLQRLRATRPQWTAEDMTNRLLRWWWMWPIMVSWPKLSMMRLDFRKIPPGTAR